MFDKYSKKSPYLVAVSFGPDSMALLAMLQKEGFSLSVAHVNYHQRKEANFEQAALEQYCLKNNLELYILNVNPEDVVGNFQKFAREVRYNFFKKVSRKIKAKGLFVAQHLDDHLETYLMQNKRQKYALHWGIAEESYLYSMIVFRPLLDKRKVELEKYCQNEGIPYAIDQSNLEKKYTRNKVRLEVVSKLDTIEVSAYLKEIQERNLKNLTTLNLLKKDYKKQVFTIKENFKADEETLFLLINVLIKKKVPKFKINYGLLRQLQRVIEEKRSNWRYRLSNDFYLYKSYQTILLVARNIEQNYEYQLDHPQKMITAYFEIDLENNQSANIKLEDYPLTIRNVRKTDKMIIKGYQKTITRAFIDWKLPAYWRASWPVILNKYGQVIFTPRYNSNFKISKDDFFLVKCPVIIK